MKCTYNMTEDTFKHVSKYLLVAPSSTVTLMSKCAVGACFKKIFFVHFRSKDRPWFGCTIAGAVTEDQLKWTSAMMFGEHTNILPTPRLVIT